MRVDPGALDRWVELDDPVEDGTPKVFNPSRVKCQVRAGGASGEEGIAWSILMRFHPEVTFNTRITLADGRMLFVREIDNLGDLERSGYMTVRCVEVATP